MRKSSITANFQTDIQTVWDIVTDNKNYTWRSDLSKIDVLNGGKKFIEYTKTGYSTTFTITVKEVCKRYEFDMENKNIIGHWSGIFNEPQNGGTTIEFSEELKIKNPIIEIFSYAFMNIKKMQQAYVNDLRKILSE